MIQNSIERRLGLAQNGIIILVIDIEFGIQDSAM